MNNHRLDTDTHVLFYENDFYCLSNFSAFRVRWQGFDFDTSEHAYQWSKFARATSSVARAVAKGILNARSAHEAFKMAEEFVRHRQPDWHQQRVHVMRSILFCKASQHEYVHRKLLETGTRTLVEDSWRDSFWGWGENHDGRNMLGLLWMELRDELRPRQS